MKTFYRILALALAGLLLPMTAASTAHATEGWVPDEALVVDVPAQYVDDDLAEQRQALADLGLQPGDVVTVKWVRQPHSECLGYNGASCAYLEIGGRLYPVAEDDPFLVPSGPASADGRVYPSYNAGLMEYDVSSGSGFSMGSAVYDDEPGKRRARGMADYVDNGMLMWQSAETYDDGYVRVGAGLLDLWVEAGDLAVPTPIDAPDDAAAESGPDDTAVMTETDGVVIDEPVEAPSVQATVEPASEQPSAVAVAPVASESAAPWMPFALGGGALFGLALIASLVVSAVRQRRSA